MNDAVHDGLLAKSPCSRRTSPHLAQQRVYVTGTPSRSGNYMTCFLSASGSPCCSVHLSGSVSARRADSGLKMLISCVASSVPRSSTRRKNSRPGFPGRPFPSRHQLAVELSAQITRYGRHATLLTGTGGGQLSSWAVERAMRTARKKVPGLPAGFRYHDLRHYFASLLIASGADVKTVQARLRHASAKTTLDTYGHMWPNRDESTPAAVDAVIMPGRTAAEQRRGEPMTMQVTAGLHGTCEHTAELGFQ